MRVTQHETDPRWFYGARKIKHAILIKSQSQIAETFSDKNEPSVIIYYQYY